jgi:small subunit ribosomal protein S12
MSTILQHCKKKQKFRPKLCLVKILNKCPQKKGVCAKVLIMTPKKPCSARRKVMRVRIFSMKKSLFAYIPGSGHTLQKFSRVLIQGRTVPDLPGVHYAIIRGKYDLRAMSEKRQGRSKYGVQLLHVARKKDRRNALINVIKEKKLFLQKNY